MERRHFLRSVGYALKGIAFAFRTQRNLRWHGIAACATLVLALGLRLHRVEMAILVVVIGLVICAEVLNTAVELTIDMIKITEHPVARIVKDVAAGAVLITAIMSIAVAWFVIWPHLVRWVAR